MERFRKQKILDEYLQHWSRFERASGFMQQCYIKESFTHAPW
jgi:hypothetical protein